jgi:hypothetical protein
MQTWQYQMEWRTVSPTDTLTQFHLNSLGSSGWEIISIQPAGQVNGLPQYLFFFKRLLG